MSLIIAFIERSDATVAVDVDAVAQDGSRCSSSKLLVVPHLNAVTAHRGASQVSMLYLTRCLSAHYDSADQMLDGMPKELEELFGYSYDGGIGDDFLAVAWSDRHSSMRGRRVVKRYGAPEISVQDLFDTQLIAPWDESLPKLPAPAKRKHLDRIAGEQVRWMHSAHKIPCGGGLIVCDLARRHMTISQRDGV